MGFRSIKKIANTVQTYSLIGDGDVNSTSTRRLLTNRRLYHGKWAAFFVSALLFVAMHYRYWATGGIVDPPSVLQYLMASSIFGWLRWRSGSTLQHSQIKLSHCRCERSEAIHVSAGPRPPINLRSRRGRWLRFARNDGVRRSKLFGCGSSGDVRARFGQRLFASHSDHFVWACALSIAARHHGFVGPTAPHPRPAPKIAPTPRF
jgi:hypothetical protein